jgi:hypothetical protein
MLSPSTDNTTGSFSVNASPLFATPITLQLKSPYGPNPNLRDGENPPNLSSWPDWTTACFAPMPPFFTLRCQGCGPVQ